MKKRKKDCPEIVVLHKIRLGAVREEQVRQGIFDGRFRTKVVPSKKVLCKSKL
jgi:hypothetical protein